MTPDPILVERFRNDLAALVPAGTPLGIAVSGGADSLALLLLAHAAASGRVEAATVDHGLREESADEARLVATVCDRLGIPHAILTADWTEKPQSALQERARDERYRRLGSWMDERGLDALATAHHADDQAETLLMRLARGSGLQGLAAIRALSVVPGSTKALVRPLLGWASADLKQICAAAGLDPVDDPSNHDDRFERVRVRRFLATSDLLLPERLARSAACLGDAEDALAWAMEAHWRECVEEAAGAIAYRPCGAPAEIVRRVVARAILILASEGQSVDLRGGEIDRIVAALTRGGTATLRGVLCVGGDAWRFSRAPARQPRLER